MEPGDSRGRTTLEATVLGLLAAVPLVPYLSRLAQKPVPRFAIDGDYAGLELATRYVFTGRTLLGPYSRFEFNHPGPAYFFFLAPIHRLYGETSTGLFAGAILLNAAAAFAIAFAMRLLATRAQAMTATVGVLAWLAAFGNATPLPWNPTVVVLPLFAFLVLAALFASGKIEAAPGATFFGMLVAETHLSTVPTVAVVSLAAIAAYRFTSTNRTRRTRLFLVAAAGVFLVLFLPPLIEQLTAVEGNMTKLAHFFVERKEPPKAFAEAWRAWTTAMSWLPDRLVHRTIAGEGEPNAMRSEPIDAAPSPLTLILFVMTLATGGAVSWRKRDRASIALLGIGTLASVASLLALRAIVGTTYYYLVFWTTAATTLVWLGALSAVAFAIPRHVGTALALLFALLATSNQGAWLAKNPIAINAVAPRTDARTIYGALREYMREHDAVPVFHRDASWNTSLALMNELARDGLEGRVEERERWILGRQFRTPTGAPRIFHVYTSTWYQKLDTAPCLELVKKDGDTALYVSPVEVTRCP